MTDKDDLVTMTPEALVALRAKVLGEMTGREVLEAVHRLRHAAHWGKSASPSPFPADDKEMRAAQHGSPLDTVVHMARWQLALAQAIKDAGLLK